MPAVKIWSDERYEGLRARLQRALPRLGIDTGGEFTTISPRAEGSEEGGAEGAAASQARDGIIHLVPLELGDAVPREISELPMAMVVVEVSKTGVGLEAGLHAFAMGKLAEGVTCVVASPRRWAQGVVDHVRKVLAEEQLFVYDIQTYLPASMPPYKYDWQQITIITKAPVTFVVCALVPWSQRSKTPPESVLSTS